MTDIKPITKGFKCDFRVIDSDLSGVVTINIEGDLSIVFSGPDIINNVGIRVKEDSIIIEVEGLSERYSRADAPKDSPALHLYDALSSMQNLSPTIEDDTISVKGQSQSGEFFAILNGMGYITEIRFNKIDKGFVFENHTPHN